jgi:hypothetical protein
MWRRTIMACNLLEKLTYKERIIVDELRKRTKNKERRTKNKKQRTKNKVFTVERTRSRKCLSRLLLSPVFYL